MAKEMDDGEFWLPSDFLDDDLLEMESEEEERISVATQMANPTFKNTPKLATSPQSTLYGLGGRSFSSSGGGGSPEVPSPPSPSTPFMKMGDDDALELLYEAEKMMRMRKDSVQEKALLIQQQLRAAQFYQLRRQQLMKLQLQQQQQQFAAAAALGRNSKIRSRGAYGVQPPNLSCSSAWPPLQKLQQQQQQQQQRNNHNGSGMRAVFLNGSNGKRESTGTGVFLPRRVGTPNEPRKKSGCSTVLLPARVVQALNLDLSEMRMQPRLPTGYVLDHDAMVANLPKRSYHYPQQQPAPVSGHEIRLPQEWTY